MIKKSLWFFIFALLAVSCLEEPECFSLVNNIVGISFKKMSDNKADTVVFASVTATGTDSIFFSNVQLIGANLPLDYYTNQTVFTFEGLDQTYDLTLNYDSKPQFVAEDCGERFVLTGLKATSQTFDSVRVIGTIPKGRGASGTHIEVYRCPNTTRIKLRFASEVTISQIATDYATSFLIPSTPTTTLVVPLNPAATSSSMHFVFSDGTTRDLVLGYNLTSKTYFHACGEQAVISDFTVVDTDFTTVNIVRNTIQDPNETNLEITF